MDREEILLTVDEVSTILRVGHNKVYELIRKKKIIAFRIDHHDRKDKYNRHPWRIKESELDKYISVNGKSYSELRENNSHTNNSSSTKSSVRSSATTSTRS